MHVAALIGTLVIALDGESTGGSSNTGVAIVAAVSMISGYVLLAALWWFVFRDRSKRANRRRGPSE